MTHEILTIEQNDPIMKPVRLLALLLLIVSGSAFAQDTSEVWSEGIAIVRDGTVAELEQYLDVHGPFVALPEPEDLTPDFFPWPLVERAVFLGGPAKVRVFLERGVPLSHPVSSNETLLMVLMDQDDPEYAAIIRDFSPRRRPSATAIADRFFRDTLNGEPPSIDRLEEWAAEPDLTLPPTLPLAFWYVQPNERIRAAIGELSPGVISADPVALLLAESQALDREQLVSDYWPVTPDFLASSFLPDARVPFRYHTAAAFDGDLSTSWVEGRDGPGIGDSLLFQLPVTDRDAVHELQFFPGYGVERWFRPNNRVRQATVELYTQSIVDVPFGPSGLVYRLYESVEVSVPDAFEFVSILLPQEYVSEAARRGGRMIGRIIIDEVYPGTDYDDTCIAEVQLVVR